LSSRQFVRNVSFQTSRNVLAAMHVNVPAIGTSGTRQ
jgi:hypothetical protein